MKTSQDHTYFKIYSEKWELAVKEKLYDEALAFAVKDTLFLEIAVKKLMLLHA